MLIMGHPQFETQDDAGIGRGIPPIPEWQLSSLTVQDPPELRGLNIEEEVRNVFIRLRSIFRAAERMPFTSTQLHDLTCFVIHRLLRTRHTTLLTECIRSATVLYMFIIQGPTYFSHGVIFNDILNRLTEHLQQRDLTQHTHDPIDIWFCAVGMVASIDTPHYPWYLERAGAAIASLHLNVWEDVFIRIKCFLWLETQQGENVFRPHWGTILKRELPEAVRPESVRIIKTRFI